MVDRYFAPVVYVPDGRGLVDVTLEGVAGKSSKPKFEELVLK